MKLCKLCWGNLKVILSHNFLLSRGPQSLSECCSALPGPYSNTQTSRAIPCASAWLSDRKGTNISDGKAQGVVLARDIFMLPVHFGHPTSAAAAADLLPLTVTAFWRLVPVSSRDSGGKFEAPFVISRRDVRVSHLLCLQGIRGCAICPCSSSAWVPKVALLNTC